MKKLPKILETKGLEDLEVARKDVRARLGTRPASRLRPPWALY